MKHLNLYLLIFVTITFCSFTFTGTFSSPSTKKMAGKWESVFRAGNNNCAKDFILDLKLDGKATLTSGSRYSECTKGGFTTPSWTVGKTEARMIGKMKNKWDTLILKDGEYEDDDVNIIIVEFVDDYMKVYIEVVDGDTTGPKKFILKKVN